MISRPDQRESGKPKRLPRAKMLSRVQNLIGQARAAYENDRAECRASSVLVPLIEAFDLVVTLREKYKP